jgi:hypothetical protein
MNDKYKFLYWNENNEEMKRLLTYYNNSYIWMIKKKTLQMGLMELNNVA